jgi:F-type H+-transporting ATPase subunit epsilon
MAALDVRIVAPDRTVFEGEAAALVVPAWDGKLGVLPGHAPMIALLGQGELAVDLRGGGSRTFFVAGGVAKVEEDGITILTEYAGSDPPESLPGGIALGPDEVQVATRIASRGSPLV